MSNIFRSIRTQLIASLVLVAIVVFGGFLMGAIGLQQINDSQRLLSVTANQRAEVFRLSELVRRLDDAFSDTTAETIVNTLNSAITEFDNRQDTLRNGNEIVNPINDPTLILLLDDMDDAWATYREILLNHVDADTSEKDLLFSQTQSQAVRVFTLADRIEIGTQSNIEEIRQRLLTITFLIIGVVVLGLAYAIYISVRVVRSITQLQETAKKLGAGNYAVRASASSYSELDDLSQGFNNMADQLSTIIEDLENRVAERTAELKLARDEALTGQRMAQETSRIKSEFLSTMSHELRTPLNAIEGFTSIMLGGMGIELSPKAEDMTKRISSNSKRLLALINDFLDLSRIESGRLDLVYDPIIIKSLVQKWKNQVGVLAEEKSLDFNVHISEDLPPTLLSDEDALTKITINLLGNAFKFTSEGHVTLNIEHHEDNWIIAVSDSGIGIPSHAREYIFDEFRQVDGSSKRIYGGTGLGLSLVQKLARAMGGTVRLDSEIDQGSTFTVTLPLRVPEQEGAVS